MILLNVNCYNADMSKKQRRKSRDTKPVKQQDLSRRRWFPQHMKVGLRRLSKALGLVLLCTSAVFFASWISLFDLLRIDSWVERKFISYANAFTYEDIDQDVVLITAVEDAQGNGSLGKPDETWRRYHAKLLDAMTRAKAKVVAFDLFFEASSDSNQEGPSKIDQDFGEAIRRATESGTTVVIGVREFNIQEGTPVAFSTPLQKYLEERNWGFLDVGGVDKETTAVRKLRLAMEMNADLPSWVEAQDPKVIPSFTLQVVRAGLMPQAGAAFYDKKEGQIKLRDDSSQFVKSIPVDETMNLIIDEKETAALDKINHPYHEVYNNLNNSQHLQNVFSGKIIIVGYLVKEDMRTITNGESRYGVQIQANAVSNLLQGVHVSKLDPASNFLVIAVMSTVGFLMGSRYRHLFRYKIPIELKILTFQIDLPVLLFVISGVYLILIVVLYKYSHILLGIPYHIAVLFLTFWLADQVEARKKSRDT